MLFGRFLFFFLLLLSRFCVKIIFHPFCKVMRQGQKGSRRKKKTKTEKTALRGGARRKKREGKERALLKGETPGRSQKMGADAALYIGETHSVLIDKRCIETVSAEQNASGRRETKKKKMLYHGGTAGIDRVLSHADAPPNRQWGKERKRR